MRTNAERAERAARVLEVAAPDDNDTLTNIYDLMCDLAHLADRDAEGVVETPGFYALDMAEYHYRAELEEERRAE